MAAYDEARRLIAADPSRFTTIVLLTDGEKHGRPRRRRVPAFHSGLPAEVTTVPVFPVLFGESVVDEMDEVARITGGRVFDAPQRVARRGVQGDPWLSVDT